jgi:predicted nucleic acid-binding protein
MYVVDASVWVSIFVGYDAYHTASRQWLDAQVAQGSLIVAPTLALAEIAGAVARRTSHGALGMRSVSAVLRLPITRLVSVDFELARLGAETAAHLSMRGADAVYVALAQRLAVPLVTWDKEQLARGSREAQVLTPEEATAR